MWVLSTCPIHSKAACSTVSSTNGVFILPIVLVPASAGVHMSFVGAQLRAAFDAVLFLHICLIVPGIEACLSNPFLAYYGPADGRNLALSALISIPRILAICGNLKRPLTLPSAAVGVMLSTIGRRVGRGPGPRCSIPWPFSLETLYLHSTPDARPSQWLQCPRGRGQGGWDTEWHGWHGLAVVEGEGRSGGYEGAGWAVTQGGSGRQAEPFSTRRRSNVNRKSMSDLS